MAILQHPDGYGYDDTSTVVYRVTAGVTNFTGCAGTAVYGNYPTYALPPPPPRMPPKNWRWFDVFRLLLAPLSHSNVVALMPPVAERVRTAVSLAQAARLKRRLRMQHA